MAPNFQSSFIPKEPVTEEIFKKKKAGLFGILAVSLFIATIIVSIALFAYKSILKNEIRDIQSQLAEAEKSIDKKTIGEMSQFSKKLNTVKSIIVKHQIVSRFLENLASSTISSVQFTDFNYGGLTKEGLAVTLKGKTNSYASVALQENIFFQNKYFKSVSLSNLALTDKGSVSFEASILIDPQILIYSQ